MSLPSLGATTPYVRALGRARSPADAVVAPPEEVKLRLLQPCDLRCGMCWHWQDPARGHKQLELSLLLPLLAELGALGVRRVKLTGGEPTLRPDLPEIVRAARGAGVAVTVATNAYGLTPEKAAGLVEAGVDTFHVSLDAGVAAFHDEVRGVPGAFDATVAAMRHLRERHPQVRRKLSAVVQRRSIGSLAALVPLCAELGVRELYLLLVNTEPFCAQARPSRAQYEAFYFDELPTMLEAGVAARVRLRPSPLFRALLGRSAGEQARALRGDRTVFAAELDAYAAEEYGRYFYGERACAEIQGRAEISETGHVYPCCHTEVPELAMGNVREESFGALWGRARYRDFRDPEGPLPHHPRCLTCKDSQYADGDKG